MLRLSVRFSRARHESPPSDLKVTIQPKHIQLWLGADYLNSHPLTLAELNDEASQLSLIGVSLQIQSLTTSPSV